MQLRTLVLAAAVVMAMASSASSALAFDPQPDPPARNGIQEKVHLPIYDPIVAPIGR